MSRLIPFDLTGLLQMDGFDEAVVGVGEQAGNPLVIYDYNKCIDILKRDMPEEDAVEFFEFNIACAYVGDQTPIILKTI